MTATDELRRMLDERGAEWTARDSAFRRVTYWKDAGCRPCCYSESIAGGTGGSIGVLKTSSTPAQAVEATLGRGKCEIVIDDHYRVDRVTTSWGCVCSACGGFHKFTHGEGWAYCPSCGREVYE